MELSGLVGGVLTSRGRHTQFLSTARCYLLEGIVKGAQGILLFLLARWAAVLIGLFLISYPRFVTYLCIISAIWGLGGYFRQQFWAILHVLSICLSRPFSSSCTHAPEDCEREWYGIWLQSRDSFKPAGLHYFGQPLWLVLGGAPEACTAQVGAVPPFPSLLAPLAGARLTGYVALLPASTRSSSPERSQLIELLCCNNHPLRQAPAQQTIVFLINRRPPLFCCRLSLNQGRNN